MKLAEALNERAALKKRISQLSSRLMDNARVQEGDQPAEDPEMLLQEIRYSISELELFIYRINKTNNCTQINSYTLNLLLAKRDTLIHYVSILRSFLSETSRRVDRSSPREIRICSTVDALDLRQILDTKSKELRELDAQIQQLNWTTELL